MNKVIYIKFTPLTKKVYEDCCMKTLQENGYQVEYWDVAQMFGLCLNDYESYTPHNKLSIKKVNSLQDMDTQLSHNENALFITLMTCNFKQLKMLRLLTKHHCKTVFWGPDPVYIPQKSISNKISGISLKKIKSKLGNELMKMLFKTAYLHYNDYYFNVGAIGYTALGVVDNSLLKRCHAVNINSSDFSNFFYSKYEKVVDDNYIVFIDQYFPFHPDFLICGVPTIPAEEYYKNLNHCFSILERELRLKVVIAAHPKSLRYNNEDFFDGREVFMGATCPLVKNASLVLAHDSTAIGYAIMANKPIALLTSSAMKQYLPEHDIVMSNFANRFKLPLIDMNKKELSFNKEQLALTKEQIRLYESYLYEYCTSPSVNEPNEQIVHSFVDEVFNTQ